MDSIKEKLMQYLNHRIANYERSVRKAEEDAKEYYLTFYERDAGCLIRTRAVLDTLKDFIAVVSSLSDEDAVVKAIEDKISHQRRCVMCANHEMEEDENIMSYLARMHNLEAHRMVANMLSAFLSKAKRNNERLRSNQD